LFGLFSSRVDVEESGVVDVEVETRGSEGKEGCQHAGVLEGHGKEERGRVQTDVVIRRCRQTLALLPPILPSTLQQGQPEVEPRRAGDLPRGHPPIRAEPP
jgi:hypothetical protein